MKDRKVYILHIPRYTMVNSPHTTIRMDRKTLKELRKFKVHPRESYDDVIKRAIQGELHPDDPNGSKGDASNIVEYDDLKKMKEFV